MYAAILVLHSWVRWAVVLLGLIAVARSISGSSANRWSAIDDRIVRLFIIALDLQMLLGLLLYFGLSPIVGAAVHDIGASMRLPQIRFWLVEHPVGTLAGLVLAHIGTVRVRRAPDVRKRRTARLFFGLAVLLILGSLPWPGLPYGRPLLRLP